MLAVISVDDYPFLPFEDLTCLLEDTGIGVITLCCMIVPRQKFEITTNLKSSGKNNRVVLVPCSRMEKGRTYSYFQWCGYF